MKKDRNRSGDEDYEKIKILLNASDDAAFLFSYEGVLLAMNREALRRLRKTVPAAMNKPADFFIGSEMSLFYPADFIDECRKCRNRVLKTKKPGKFRYLLLGRMTEITAYPVDRKENFPGAFAVYSRDISKEVKAEKKAKYHEQKFSDLVEQMHEGFVIIDSRLRIQYVNSTAFSFSGYMADEVLGKNYLKYMFPEDRKRARQYFDEIRHSENINYESGIISKAGHRIPMRFSIYPIYDHNGKFDGVHTILTDISDLKKNEESLRKQVLFREKIIEISSGFINIKSEDIDHSVIHALEAIGRFNDEERIALYLLDRDRDIFYKSYNWESDFVTLKKKFPKEIELKNFPYFGNILKRLEIIHVWDLKEAPPSAADELKFAERSGIKSFIVIPMIVDDSLAGFMGMGKKSPYSWSDEEVSLMKSALNIIAIAVGRRDLETELMNVLLKRFSAREQEFLKILSQGYRWPGDKRAIAKLMDVLPGTLDKFMQRIKGKVRESDLVRIDTFLKGLAGPGVNAE